MRAAGILRHVPADGADTLRRGIGRVVVAVGTDPFTDIEVDHAGLHAHPAVLEIDLQDAAHARRADDDAAGDRQRSARESCARTARHDRQPRLARDLHDLDDFLCRRRKHDNARHRVKARQAIGLVRPQLRRFDDAVALADDRPQSIDDLQRNGRWIFQGRDNHQFTRIADTQEASGILKIPG